MGIYYMSQLTKSSKVQLCASVDKFYFTLTDDNTIDQQFAFIVIQEIQTIISLNGGSLSNDIRVFNNQPAKK